MADPTLLFVHLGSELPPWLVVALRQARTFNSCDILLVAERAALVHGDVPDSLRVSCVALEDLGPREKHRAFRRVSPFDRRSRNSFWTFTAERFFVIEAVIQTLALRDVVHVENDIMLYASLHELVPKLSLLYSGIAATFDNDARCVPGIVYFPDLRAVATLTNFYLQVLQKLATAPNAVPVNDMQVLGALRSFGPQVIDHLPIVPPDYPGSLRSAAGHTVREPANYSRHLEALGCIFDAAALGQFLGGIDPRNSPGRSVGFINESCIFNPIMLKPRLQRDPDGRRVPVVETASGVRPVANLHVHSKNLAPFLSV